MGIRDNLETGELQVIMEFQEEKEDVAKSETGERLVSQVRLAQLV